MKVFFSILLSLLFTNGFSQDKLLKEVVGFYENGKPKNINYKNQNLELVKIHEVDLEGEVISEYNYNPNSGEKNGPFFNLLTDGYYNEGVLNSENFIMNIGDYSNNTEGVFWKGKVKEGRPSGDVEIYNLKEDFDVTSKLNVDVSTQMSMSVGYKLRYYDNTYKSKGTFTRTEITTLHYNENGNLEGKQKVNDKTELYFNNGKLEGYVIKNSGSNEMSRDSVFRGQSVWKVNNVFKKNNGFSPRILWNEFRPQEIKFSGTMFFGSEKSLEDEDSRINTSYGGQNIYFMTEDFSPSLNNTGMYHKGNNLTSILKSSEFENGFYGFIDSEKVIYLSKIIPSEYDCGTPLYNLPILSNNLVQDYRINDILKIEDIESIDNVISRKGLDEFLNTLKTNNYNFNNQNSYVYVNSLKNLIENKFINLSEIWIYLDNKFVNYFELNNSEKLTEVKIKSEKSIKEKEFIDSIKPDWFDFTTEEVNNSFELKINYYLTNSRRQKMFEVSSEFFDKNLISGIELIDNTIKLYIPSNENNNYLNELNDSKSKEKILKKINRKYRNYGTIFGLGEKNEDFDVQNIVFDKRDVSDTEKFILNLNQNLDLKTYLDDIKIKSLTIYRDNNSSKIIHELEVENNKKLTKEEFDNFIGFWIYDMKVEKNNGLPYLYKENLKVDGNEIPNTGKSLLFSKEDLINSYIYKFQDKSYNELYRSIFGDSKDFDFVITGYKNSLRPQYTFRLK